MVGEQARETGPSSTTERVIKLRDVLVESIMAEFRTPPRDRAQWLTIEERIRANVKGALATHEALVLKPYTDAIARRDAAKKRNMKT